MVNIGGKGVGNKAFDKSDVPTCGQATTFNDTSCLWEATTISAGQSNTSSNSGAGDGWALAKCGVDLPFKSLITTAPLATTSNAADLTMTIDNIAFTLLADGTDGELITWNACGAPAAVATGTATHVLTSNGVGTAPTFQAAAGGSCGWTVTGKQCDQTICSDSTLTTDCCLQFCGCACSVYALLTIIQFNSGATPGFKIAFTAPSCSTGKYQTQIGFRADSPSTSACFGTLDAVGGACPAPDIYGYQTMITTGASAGVIGLQWAQNTSNAACTTLKAGSTLSFRKVK